ncbi:ubiquinone biosynthesis monooxygenase Coq7 [Phlyctochytrium bullatum]|nr:ubiquinone biosynthesis monooxygenase Coq7 [Phlyctochytrium bullatum]
MLEAMLRVDHAGEIGADSIYRGQLAILQKDPKSGPVIQHMWDQEKRHLQVLEELLGRNRVRPSALRPLWETMGFALGAGTALLGSRAAMACTEAVEEVIGEHYNDQIRELLKLEPNEEIQKLIELIREFRDEELGHLDIAVTHEAKMAPVYDPLTMIIKQGCKAAIWVASRV